MSPPLSMVPPLALPLARLPLPRLPLPRVPLLPRLPLAVDFQPFGRCIVKRLPPLMVSTPLSPWGMKLVTQVQVLLLHRFLLDDLFVPNLVVSPVRVMVWLAYCPSW